MKTAFQRINSKFRNKIILLFAGILVFVITTIVAVSYKMFSDTLSNVYIQNSKERLLILSQTMDTYLQSLDNSTLSVYTDTFLVPMLYQNPNPDYAADHHITSKLQSVFLQKNESLCVSLYVFASETLYIMDRTTNRSISVPREQVTDQPWLQAAMQSKDMLLTPRAVVIGEYLPESLAGRKSCFTTARSIYNGSTPVALLLMNYSPEALEEMLTLHHSNESVISLVDAEGREFAASSYEHNITVDTVPMNDTEGCYTQHTPDGDKMVTYAALFHDQLRLAETVAVSAVIRQATDMRSAAVLIGVFCGIVALGLTVFFSHRVTNRLRALNQCMKDVQKGQWKVDLQICGNDEVSNISETFVRLIEHINRLVQEKYLMRMETQQATIKALNAQINPHFLYNTLQTISSMAREKEAYDIEVMVKSLSDFFRYTIKPDELSDQVSTVRMECKNCTDYLQLLSYRYEDNLLYSIKMQPEAGNVLIPRLMLQLLTENAVLHGIDSKSGQGMIMIDIAMQQDGCRISVSDTGSGMSPEVIQDIYAAFEQESSKKHLGLKNVYARLKILYGDTFDIQITSRPNLKTTVEILLKNPRYWEERNV